MKEQLSGILLAPEGFIPGKDSIPKNQKNLSDDYLSVDLSTDDFLATQHLGAPEIKTQVGNSATGLENNGILNNA